MLQVQGQESIEERLLEEQAESSEQSELLEIILELQQNPIDLNSAGLRELARIPVLTPKLRFGIVDYRTSHGLFVSMDELLGVPGMTKEIYELLAELVYIPRASRKFQCPRIQWRTRLIIFKAGLLLAKTLRGYRKLSASAFQPGRIQR